MNGVEVDGRALSLQEARPPRERTAEDDARPRRQRKPKAAAPKEAATSNETEEGAQEEAPRRRKPMAPRKPKVPMSERTESKQTVYVSNVAYKVDFCN